VEPVTLEDVGPGNWREAIALEVTERQRGYVASIEHYLALCAYSGLPWNPMLVRSSERAVGFVMWGIDDADGSFWIGGLVIDAKEQRTGFGRAVVEQLVARAREEGRPSVALSYHPDNDVARRLYAGLGFKELGEMEGNEIVARLPLR
jgi:diamine N-acetyltransferase